MTGRIGRLSWPQSRGMKLGLLLAAVSLVSAGCVSSTITAASTAPPPSPPAGTIIYGDSNLVFSQDNLPYGTIVRAQLGYAPCDWFDQMRRDAVKHPPIVVLVFTGNTYSDCASAKPRYSEYLQDFKMARSKFPSSTKVYVALPPPTKSPAEKYPYYFVSASNADVKQAVLDTGLPRVDTWTPLGGAAAPYAIWDGIHLNATGQKIFATALTHAWW